MNECFYPKQLVSRSMEQLLERFPIDNVLQLEEVLKEKWNCHQYPEKDLSMIEQELIKPANEAAIAQVKKSINELCFSEFGLTHEDIFEIANNLQTQVFILKKLQSTRDLISLLRLKYQEAQGGEKQN